MNGPSKLGPYRCASGPSKLGPYGGGRVDDDTNWQEKNIARLLKAGFDRSARPDPETRSRTWRRLLAEVRQMRPEPSFPGGALCLLAAGLLLLAVTLGLRVARDTHAALAAPLVVAACGVGLNVIMAPVAAVLIVWRRNHV